MSCKPHFLLVLNKTIYPTDLGIFNHTKDNSQPHSLLLAGCHTKPPRVVDESMCSQPAHRLLILDFCSQIFLMCPGHMVKFRNE